MRTSPFNTTLILGVSHVKRDEGQRCSCAQLDRETVARISAGVEDETRRREGDKTSMVSEAGAPVMDADSL